MLELQCEVVVVVLFHVLLDSRVQLFVSKNLISLSCDD
jgi:hypothetical protein